MRHHSARTWESLGVREWEAAPGAPGAMLGSMTKENIEHLKLEFRNEVAKVFTPGGGNYGSLKRIFGQRGLDEQTMDEIISELMKGW